MTAVSIDIRKITGRIGAEIVGLDPAADLDAAQVTFLTEALHEHKALVFRGVSLDDAGQQRFARYFGELTKAHPTVPAVNGAPTILPVDSEEGRANHWPTDVTFVHNPPKASTLRSLVEPQRAIKAGGAFWEPGGDVIHYQDGNNLADAESEFVVTMFGVVDQPMLIPVSAEELEKRCDRRALRP